jgi:exonuclease SbcC
VIPLRLQLSGFLSYRDPVELDFSGFNLACISGQNGAGKSSLLDAMTWALFGQARKRDESVVNLQSTAAEVTFTFEYENNKYRVMRSLTRGKTTILEFQIFDGNDWRPLTEHTNRETQARIEKVLRLDYDTFINVSFFLQGRADQFAQQVPARRKEILGNILGLEIWEDYKERTAEKRKGGRKHPRWDRRSCCRDRDRIGRGRTAQETPGRTRCTTKRAGDQPQAAGGSTGEHQAG